MRKPEPKLVTVSEPPDGYQLSGYIEEIKDDGFIVIRLPETDQDKNVLITVSPDELIGPHPECERVLGWRPWWMSPDQYDQCYCSRPAGHKDKCYCGRHLDDAEEPRRKYLEARNCA